jgi:hypothetical protein
MKTATQIKKDALREETLRLLAGLPDNMQKTFARIFPSGLGAASEKDLGSAYALVVQSVKRVAGR